MRMRSLVLAAATLVGGCAHNLATDEATAFKTLANANRDSFRSLATSESDAVTVFVRHRLEEGNGSVAYQNCKLAPPPAEVALPCVVVWTSPLGRKIELHPTAANTRALIGALADYSDEMAALAEAKDVTEAQSATEGVGTAVKALATAAGAGPIASVIVDAALWVEKGRMIDKRRRALLQAAEKANPAVQRVATLMHDIGERLRSNLQFTADSRLSDAALEIGAANVAPVPVGKPANDLQGVRGAAFADMVQAEQDLQAARDLNTDFGALSRAHTTLIAALRDPKRSTADALADLKTFLGLLKAAETATKGK